MEGSTERSGSRPAASAQQVDLHEIDPPRVFQSDIPKVKAYSGRLPEGEKGFEFETSVAPDKGHVPGKPTFAVAAFKTTKARSVVCNPSTSRRNRFANVSLSAYVKIHDAEPDRVGHSLKFITSMTIEELGSRFAAAGEPAYRSEQVLEWVYRKRAASFDEMKNLPAALRTSLAAEFEQRALTLVRKTGSNDTTRKFLFRLVDGQLIETVVIPASPALYGEASDRRTLCVSTQVGCAYGCRFCASGLNGWKRNLEAGEIVEQVLTAEALAGEKVNNLVFMGMGEPLANYDSLMRAISIINAPWGLGIGARHVTVSTSGLVPRIRDLADQPLQIRLAISLHGATDEVRNRIMPVNRKYPMAELLEACGYYASRKKQRLTFEYILIENVNDASGEAHVLAAHARRLGAKVNLIPYNTVDGLAWTRSPDRVQKDFHAILRSAGVPATIRREKGHDIAAACGQLRLQTERENSFAGSQSVL